MPKRHAIVPLKDVNQQVFVRRFGHYLKKSGKIDVPTWADCVKTGYAKELPPNTPDWLYIRMASIIRRVYMRCPSGVGGLARRYGSKNRRRGVRPAHTAQGSRKLIRYSLQQFEKLGWVRKAERGRKLTRRGKQFLDQFSGRVRRSPMVQDYWKRRQKQEKLKRKLERQTKRQAQATTAGDDDQAQVAPDTGATNDSYQTPQDQNVDVVNEYDY
jgi:small subunit ribosomal protein S19e